CVASGNVSPGINLVTARRMNAYCGKELRNFRFSEIQSKALRDKPIADYFPLLHRRSEAAARIEDPHFSSAVDLIFEVGEPRTGYIRWCPNGGVLISASNFFAADSTKLNESIQCHFYSRKYDFRSFFQKHPLNTCSRDCARLPQTPEYIDFCV